MDRTSLLATLRAEPLQDRIITALDVPSAEEGLALAGRLGPHGRYVKVGLELFSAAGPTIVQLLQGRDKRIFLDLKYHDIPNTVASAALIAARLGAAFCTVHAASGRAALEAAAAALATAPPDAQGRRPALLAVTVLTSLGPAELAEVAPSTETVPQRVERLARLAWDCGCDGLVCAATDLVALRAALGPEPLVVTPGIRPAGASPDDQTTRRHSPARARRRRRLPGRRPTRRAGGAAGPGAAGSHRRVDAPVTRRATGAPTCNPSEQGADRPCRNAIC